MRFPAGRVVATYSYTDDHVRSIVRYTLILGALCGSVVTSFILSVLN